MYVNFNNIKTVQIFDIFEPCEIISSRSRKHEVLLSHEFANKYVHVIVYSLLPPNQHNS